MMKFVEFIAAHNFDCGTFVGPGRAATGKMQVLVQKPPRGSYVGEMTHMRSIWLYKNFIVGLGNCIRRFHDASRLFSKENPDIAQTFDKDEVKIKGMK